MIEEISKIVKQHFPYDAMFVDKLPRKRNGVNLIGIATFGMGKHSTTTLNYTSV